jgi:hypothetical protein
MTFWEMTSCNLVECANVSEEPAASIFLNPEDGDNEFLRTICIYNMKLGARGSVDEALFYKPEGHGFVSRGGHRIFQLT